MNTPDSQFQNPYSNPTQLPPAQLNPTNDAMTVGDWLLCILCSGIGCILGIIRLVQGKPNGGKMIAISLAFMVIWTIVRVGLTVALQNGQ